MAGWAESLGGWFSNGKNLEGLGSLIGAGGSIYGGIKQADAARDMVRLDKKRFNLNAELIAKDEEDKKKQEAAYEAAFGGAGVITL